MRSCGMALDATARDHAGILAETGYTNPRRKGLVSGRGRLRGAWRGQGSLFNLKQA